MSAIAHQLERAGLLTVVIGLVRLHLEKMNPPRALWVPFELGRPLGPANDPAFQRRVLREALAMLSIERAATAECSVIVDFNANDPSRVDDPEWCAPSLPSSAHADCAVTDELAVLAPLKTAAETRYGHDPVGVSKVDIGQAAAHVDAVYRSRGDLVLAPSRRQDLSPAVMLRLMADDLKIYYLQAASANGNPSSRQLNTWLWHDTRLGHVIQAIRRRMLDSDDAKLANIGDRFLVPRAYQH